MAKAKVRKRDTYVLSVDPGVDFGWALWSCEHFDVLCPPVDVGVVKTKAKDEWQRRTLDGLDVLSGIMRDNKCASVFCEWPNLFAGAHGRAVAGRGDLGKLYAWCGGLMYAAHAQGVPFVPVTVQQWKGQLSKRIVCDRIVNRIGNACASLTPRTGKDRAGSHDWDAVGIGLWVKGEF